ncbi:MAG: glycosyltransferase family 4 protein [Solirubrobacteraceae bacterium]
MRIGVDATSWGNRRGFGRFARNAVGRLIALDGESEYVLVTDAADQTPLPNGVRVRSVRLSRPPGEAACADDARSPVDLARLSAAAARGRFDAFLFPSVYTYFPVPGCSEVVGIHDAIADQLPHLTLPSRRARTFWKAKERTAIRRAARVFTVSEASRTVLVERFGLSSDGIAIVPEAPDPVFTPRGASAIERELAPLGLEAGRYFLFAGGISPHKNVLALVDAYARLREVRESGAGGERGAAGGKSASWGSSAADVPPLVLVGDLKDDPFFSIARDLRARIVGLELEAHVRLPGFVSDEALACLYSAATAVVLPSLIEGFGLPAVEAAACGAPVLLSDLPSHRASLGGAALYFDPEDVQAIAAAMAWALEEPGRTLALAQGAREAVAGLTWDASARALRQVVVEAAGA